ncbi:hypothetical protein HYV86_04870 [Candidatus Woesearchaeota archaeon]|nr:hypothetical protein [Candidatus Woesearchaeota archaeon]
MKHSIPVTLILLVLFLCAQYIGIGILVTYIDPIESAIQGEVTFYPTPLFERPDDIKGDFSFVPIMISILVGTVLLLILMKYKLRKVWKLWFLLSIVISLTVALGSVLPAFIALGLALILGIWKIFFPNIWVHNATELLLYGGLAAIFVPLLNLFSVSILLILIGIYDAYAVWKSKHMITLAQETTNAKVFAGLFIPYGKDNKNGFGKEKSSESKHVDGDKHHSEKNRSTLKVAENKHESAKNPLPPPKESRTAILGGGDIAFPLLFAGVILKDMGLWQSLIIPVFALVGLGLLLWYGKQNKFYPAMPFIGAGCFVGLGVVWLIQLLI